MEQLAITTTVQDDIGRIRALVLDGVTSTHSKIAYDRALTEFLAWYRSSRTTQMDKATVQAYKAHLLGLGLAASSINQKLSAIRKLAMEAADNGLVDPVLAGGISRVNGVKSAGVRTGNWLTREKAQELLEMPSATTLKGLRDRAILAVMLGCGLRRSEVATLTFAHIQQRDGRWAIVDLVGKGGRTRTVPMPSWAKLAIDRWVSEAEEIDDHLTMNSGRVFRSVNKSNYVDGASMTGQAIADVVKCYAAKMEAKLAAHDLRRTFAKLAEKGGAKLTQIQLTLGHASIKTTERYLGLEQDLTDAPCDHLGLRL